MAEPAPPDDQAALTLAATLLPGGAGFPAFAATPAGPLLLQRLRPQDRPPMNAAPAIPEAAAEIEAQHPAAFAEFRKQAYLAYYEQPQVIAAIRALGHPYNETPLPDGYPATPADIFDPARDAPRHPRGRWIDTDDVQKIDVAALNLE